MSCIPPYEPKETICIPKKIRFNPNLSFSEKMFYAELISMAQDKKIEFASRKLSKLFNVTHQTIHNWVKNLRHYRFIDIEVDPDNNTFKHYLKFIDQ